MARELRRNTRRIAASAARGYGCVPSAPHVADLLAFHLTELRGVMAERAYALDATGLAAPSVTFWTAWNEDTLLGFAALKQLDSATGEVKSMRAAPAARGTGVGRALLQHVIAQGRRRGLARLYLETGTGQHHVPAVALYRSAGFLPCPPFADYGPSPYNQFFRLDLAPENAK